MLAIFLDIESSGLDSFHHRVLEIAFKVVDVHTGEEKLTYQSIVKQPLEVWEKHDPISIQINGFSWEKVLLGQSEEVVGREVVQIFNDLGIERGKAVYICQNPAFDRGFFSQIVDVYTQEKYHWPYHWLDFASMYWALQVKNFDQKHEQLPAEMSLSKNAIAQQFGLPIESSPHSALNGVNHLILCYRTVVGFGHPILSH
ncbi:Putative exonuclease [Candidatus Protochlamydia naegleriophila]|uniref:Putative exonuclease n=1 Tax=Candidatus Protochlamydia naegleriophila TaxID=389348 RepID=A0A0U5JDH1_9BACT|nr:DNA polymerase III subunit epsilon [Candidatus Protochlamydia naegleriophila]CUI17207.1 Putative exonuclease [Candidatus Protochlamydia naegleriophila]